MLPTHHLLSTEVKGGLPETDLGAVTTFITTACPGALEVILCAAVTLLSDGPVYSPQKQDLRDSNLGGIYPEFQASELLSAVFTNETVFPGILC